jgi:hypothetical protein
MARWLARPGGAARRRATSSCVSFLQGLCECNGKDDQMPVRLKKLIGTILLVLLVVVYSLLATMIAVAQLSQSGPIAHLLFFLIGGLVWILPAMVIIKWMVSEPKRG